jgi:hypothetical protein
MPRNEATLLKIIDGCHQCFDLGLGEPLNKIMRAQHAMLTQDREDAHLLEREISQIKFTHWCEVFSYGVERSVNHRAQGIHMLRSTL